MIRTKLIIIFLTISIIPLTIFGTLNYLNTEQALTKETFNKLETRYAARKKHTEFRRPKFRKIEFGL
jgi:hypothetical protein